MTSSKQWAVSCILRTADCDLYPVPYTLYPASCMEQRVQSFCTALPLHCSLFFVLCSLDEESRREQRQVLDRAGTHMCVRQRIEELLAILLSQQPLVEHSHDTAVFLRANESP